ncbi:MAG TPA: hypothetical protein VF306_10915 [Pirellulales bacterium]
MDPIEPQENPYEPPRFDTAPREADARRRARDSELQVSDWVLAVLCSSIGCIMGIIWLIQGKPKGGKMVGISLLFVFLWNILRVALQSALRQQ